MTVLSLLLFVRHSDDGELKWSSGSLIKTSLQPPGDCPSLSSSLTLLSMLPLDYLRPAATA
jgi:hypothetical protein